MMFNSVPRILPLATFSAAAGAALAASPADAAETTSNLSVTATVTGNCSVDTTPVAFGNVDVTAGSNVDATGTLSVTCTSGTAWTATADEGTGSSATFANRQMANGTNLLNYGLYTNSTRTMVWGDGLLGATTAFSGTGSGAAQTNTIYGRVPLGQTSVPAGSYADTVTVTVTY